MQALGDSSFDDYGESHSPGMSAGSMSPSRSLDMSGDVPVPRSPASDISVHSKLPAKLEPLAPLRCGGRLLGHMLHLSLLSLHDEVLLQTVH